MNPTKKYEIRKYSFRDKGLWRGRFAVGDVDCARRGFESRLEVSYGKHKILGFRLHFGDRHSETPFDFHIGFWFLSFFGSFNTPNLGKYFEKITQGHKRDISLRIHSGQLWWKLWFDDDGGHDRYHRCDSCRKPKVWPWSLGRQKHRGWMCLRDGNIDLNPVSAFWGHRGFKYDTLDQRRVEMTFSSVPDDTREVLFTLQKQTQARDHGPKWARRPADRGLVAAWDCGKGIPYRNDSWKGDSMYGSAVKINNVDNWYREATLKLYKRVQEDRKKNHYNHSKG